MSIKENFITQILKHKNSDSFLDYLISVKCFLINAPDSHWYIFKNSVLDQKELNEKQSLSSFQIRQINERNIEKLGLKPIDLIIFPKNRKLELLNIIDNYINDIILDDILIFDTARVNPFNTDPLYDFIDNSAFISEENKNIYQKRLNEKEKLINFFQYEPQIFNTCLNVSRYNKAIDFWKNTWGISFNYNNPTEIDYLII